jgi:5,10-methylene-tetrahydrofolate dehydrogenase/methenyl tetrahydrofolate cyclohydrolase
MPTYAMSAPTDGILYETWRVPPTKDAIERAIHHAYERLDVHGILVFYPVFDKLLDIEDGSMQHGGRHHATRGPSKCSTTGVYYKSMDDYFRDLVLPQKDVEGYHRKAFRVNNPGCREDEEQLASCGSPIDNGKLMSSCASQLQNSTPTTDTAEGQYGPIYPCTTLALFRILESFLTQHISTNLTDASTDWIKKKCFAFANITMTIINRSEVLGLPLATMLVNMAGKK